MLLPVGTGMGALTGSRLENEWQALAAPPRAAELFIPRKQPVNSPRKAAYESLIPGSRVPPVPGPHPYGCRSPYLGKETIAGLSAAAAEGGTVRYSILPPPFRWIN